MSTREERLQRLARQCEFEYYRASGPGGQHRNKVETAVKVLHGPTGLTARATERRSRTQNRKEALRRLAVKIAARNRRRKKRVPTIKSASVRRREVDSKRRLSKKKKSRLRVRGED